MNYLLSAIWFNLLLCLCFLWIVVWLFHWLVFERKFNPEIIKNLPEIGQREYLERLVNTIPLLSLSKYLKGIIITYYRVFPKRIRAFLHSTARLKEFCYWLLFVVCIVSFLFLHPVNEKTEGYAQIFYLVYSLFLPVFLELPTLIKKHLNKLFLSNAKRLVSLSFSTSFLQDEFILKYYFWSNILKFLVLGITCSFLIHLTNIFPAWLSSAIWVVLIVLFLHLSFLFIDAISRVRRVRFFYLLSIYAGFVLLLYFFPEDYVLIFSQPYIQLLAALMIQNLLLVTLDREESKWLVLFNCLLTIISLLIVPRLMHISFPSVFCEPFFRGTEIFFLYQYNLIFDLLSIIISFRIFKTIENILSKMVVFHTINIVKISSKIIGQLFLNYIFCLVFSFLSLYCSFCFAEEELLYNGMTLDFSKIIIILQNPFDPLFFTAHTSFFLALIAMGFLCFYLLYFISLNRINYYFCQKDFSKISLNLFFLRDWQFIKLNFIAFVVLIFMVSILFNQLPEVVQDNYINMLHEMGLPKKLLTGKE